MRAVSQTLEHVGEWQVAIDADTLEGVFTEAARVVARAVGTTGADSGQWEPIAVQARTLATLLVDWTNELLGRSETSGRAYARVRNFQLRIESSGAAHVSAEVQGRPVDVWLSPLKAATYHRLDLSQRDGRWHATLLFDV
jgi:SHS2 domain-containing protein